MSRWAMLAGAALAATTVRAATGLPQRALPGGAQRWARTNHAGHEVSLAEGPTVVLGSALALPAAPVAGLAAVAAGGLGLLDDLAGTPERRGLRGHLGALRSGEVTTGAVKVLGLVAIGLGSALACDRRIAPRTIAGAGVVAGTANLINLFDLRPGRALKVTLVLAVPLLVGGGWAEGVLTGTALATLPEDLRGQRMLGDTGANALGALAGVLIVARTGWLGRATLLTGLVALTLASERVSFTRVIADHDVLRRLDEWGREGA